MKILDQLSTILENRAIAVGATGGSSTVIWVEWTQKAWIGMTSFLAGVTIILVFLLQLRQFVRAIKQDTKKEKDEQV